MRDIDQRPIEEPQPITEQPLIVSVPHEASKQKRSPRWKYGLIATAILVVLSLVFAAVMLRNRPAPTSRPQQPVAPKAHITPTAIPVLNAVTPSDQAIAPVITDGNPVGVAIVDGVVYATGSKATYALRQSDGTLLWQHTSPITNTNVYLPNSTRPVVANGVVYVTAFLSTSNDKVQGKSSIEALRASDGHLLWSYSYEGDGYLEPPAIANGIAYIGAKDALLAFKADTGTRLWSFSPVKEGRFFSRPEIVNGVLYTYTSYRDYASSGFVYALNASDGKQLWKFSPDGQMQGVVVNQGVVYIPLQDFHDVGHFIALNASDGKQLWQRDVEGAPNLSPIISDGMIYFTTTQFEVGNGSANVASPISATLEGASTALSGLITAQPAIPHKMCRSSVYALQADTGNVAWHQALNNGRGACAHWLAADNGTLFTSYYGFEENSMENGTNALLALNSKNGSTLWARSLADNPGEAMFSNGILYISSVGSASGGALSAVRASDGTQLWSYPIIATWVNTLQLKDATIFVGATNGIVFAIDPATGKARWHYQTETVPSPYR